MRKSERLRILELELVRMQFHVEVLTSAVSQLMEDSQMAIPDLDSGKWYDKKNK